MSLQLSEAELRVQRGGLKVTCSKCVCMFAGQVSGLNEGSRSHLEHAEQFTKTNKQKTKKKSIH